MFFDEKSDDKNPFLSGKKNQLANTEFQADYQKVKKKIEYKQKQKQDSKSNLRFAQRLLSLQV
jgi:hypothetical protein